jgi:hypothetical protein
MPGGGDVAGVKLYGFSVPRDAGWSCVSPIGLIKADHKQYVMVIVGETHEECVRLAAKLVQQDAEETGEP